MSRMIDRPVPGHEKSPEACGIALPRRGHDRTGATANKVWRCTKRGGNLRARAARPCAGVPCVEVWTLAQGSGRRLPPRDIFLVYLVCHVATPAPIKTTKSESAQKEGAAELEPERNRPSKHIYLPAKDGQTESGEEREGAADDDSTNNGVRRLLAAPARPRAALALLRCVLCPASTLLPSAIYEFVLFFLAPLCLSALRGRRHCRRSAGSTALPTLSAAVTAAALPVEFSTRFVARLVVFHLPIRSAVSRSNREAAHVPGRCDRVVRQAWTLL